MTEEKLKWVTNFYPVSRYLEFGKGKERISTFTRDGTINKEFVEGKGDGKFRAFWTSGEGTAQVWRR